MRPKTSRTPLMIEPLENRTFLSAGPSAIESPMVADHTAIVVTAKAAKAAKAAGTKTSLTITGGTLGQPITFTVTVRAAASAGSPTGTITLEEHRSLIQTLTLTPTTSTSPKYAFSQATYTLTPQPGGSAPFFGKYHITAVFVPSGSFKKSSAGRTLIVAKPRYTSLANGVKIETIVPGSGPGVQAGQTANVLYSGYLAKNGKIFDDSANHATNGQLSTFGFIVGAGQVIPGFDEGAVGMQVGETRLIYIPWQQGYGKTGNPPSIPAKANLIFVLTLESIA